MNKSLLDFLQKHPEVSVTFQYEIYLKSVTIIMRKYVKHRYCVKSVINLDFLEAINDPDSYLSVVLERDYEKLEKDEEDE